MGMKINPHKIQVALDGRLIKKHEYFVPVVGENFDGHDFIDQALKNGAAGVIEESELYKLAANKLTDIGPIVIAITGSLGKSTTRKFIAESLRIKYKVVQGDLNTKLGLATNIINNLSADSEYFIAECGMDRPGELLDTGNFLKPYVVVLTNVNESHYMYFDSINEIVKGKADLLRTVNKNGRVYINWDSKYARRTVKYSNTKNITKYSSKDISLLPDKLSFIGEHNLLNLSVAYKIAIDEGVDKTKLDKVAKKIKTPKGRMQILKGINESTIIDDSYNASAPEAVIKSLNAAKEYFDKNLNGRFIAILGGMAELGRYSKRAHKKVAKEIIKTKPDYILLSGELAKIYDAGHTLSDSEYELKIFSDHEKVVVFIRNEVKPTKKDLFFFKGSQTTRLEKIIELLLKDPTKAKSLLPRQDARWK